MKQKDKTSEAPFKQIIKGTFKKGKYDETNSSKQSKNTKTGMNLPTNQNKK